MNKIQSLEQARRLRNRIKETWSRLTDEEIALYQLNPTEFYGRLYEKYLIDRETAQARVDELESTTKLRLVA